MTTLDRIVLTPGVMGGKACIRGLRVTVAMLVAQIGAGRSIEEVLADYPYLERDDVLQALHYAAWLAEGQEMAIAGEGWVNLVRRPSTLQMSFRVRAYL